MRTTILLLGSFAATALAQDFPREFVRAPAFELTSDGGGPVRLSDMKGSIVVLFFFRHGCPACAASHPAMQRALAEPAEKSVRVLAIDVDGIRRPTPARGARRLREELGERLEVASADEESLVLYGKVMGREQIPGTPTFFVVDRDGFVYSSTAGTIEADELMASIEFLYGVDRYRPEAWK